MRFLPIKTKKFLPPRDDIYAELDRLPKLREGDVLLITSKILAIHQGRCVKINPADEKQKQNLINREADLKIAPYKFRDYRVTLTIKDSTLIPSAGIDESNGNGWYILWPKNTNKLLKEIGEYLKKKHHIRKLALISTDSHTTPLRRGVTGVATGFYGLEPVTDLRGNKDIFGRKLKMTRVNIVDAVSAMSVMLMGEGNERTPIMILRGAKFIKFTNKNTYKKLIIKPEEDLYYPLLKIFKKK